MLIYLSLVAIIILSIITGIITTILEKKGMTVQNRSVPTNSSTTEVMIESAPKSDFLASTLEVSSLTKQVDQIDLSNATSNQEYYPEPVIVAILDDDVIC